MNPQLSERLKRTFRAYEDIDRQYIPDKKNDKNELETSIYKQRYPENVERQLIKLIRVKVPRESFELDEEGTVDAEGKVKEALVYSIQEKVINPNPDIEKEETGVYAWCTSKYGIYNKPVAIVKRDELGNPISSKITGARAMFYIKFEPEAVKKILEDFNYECVQGFSLAVAQNSSTDNWHGSFTYSVYNLEEFLYSPFDDVLGANIGGFLKDKLGRPTENGVQKYIMDKHAKRDQAEKGYKEFKERHLGAEVRSKGKNK